MQVTSSFTIYYLCHIVVTYMASRAYHRDYSRNYYHRKRAEYVDMLGGVCVRCGSTSKLQFDHKDRMTKSFAIGKLLNVSKALALEELKKCQLLCKDCHLQKSKECGDLGRKKARVRKHGTLWEYRVGCRCEVCKVNMSRYRKIQRSKLRRVNPIAGDGTALEMRRA